MDKKKILIVDDEVNFCNLVKKNLEGTGEFEVSVATKGKDGIQMAKEIKPDLVLLDIVMPEMDGGDVAGAIRGDKDIKDTPVVFLTSIVRENEDGSPIKGYPVLAKTVTMQEFLACIRENIKQF